MSLKVIVTFDDAKISAGIKKDTKKALHTAGNIIVNQMVEFAHIKSGLLKNSIMYSLENFNSPFGSIGTGKPKSSDKITKPVMPNSLRAGSGVNYAAAQEKHNAWASKAFDQVVRDGSLLNGIAKAMKF